jgi:signal transduction histidine kinase
MPREQMPKSTGPRKDTPESSLRFGRMGHDLINHIPLGVVAFDTRLKITDSNPAAQNILAPSENIAEALSAGTTQDQNPPWADRLHQALAGDQPCTFDNLSYSQNKRNYILRILCTPLSDEKTGKLIAGILLIEDITAKMAMENDLAAAERLAAVGKLAARVAHELNNPLDGILRYINLSLRLADQDAQGQTIHYLQESRKGLLRMVQIISELLEFSRSTYSAYQEADPNKIVEDAIKSLEAQTYDKKIEVIRRYSDDLPNIRSGNLFQVFCNLIKNAIDAVETEGKLEIKTSCDEYNLIFELFDNGAGLSDEAKEKLFEPFFTTKAPGKGTGLGLAICKDIIERLNGQIHAENQPEGGCLFTVSIPLEHTSHGTLEEKQNGK